jgi:hypothetical protein
MADHRRVVVVQVVVLEAVVEVVVVAVLVAAELGMNPEANGIHPHHLPQHWPLL